MTYQTTNSLRRSRRKSHIPFYRSSHLSKSKSITGAGATNGYRMFSTWYPSAIHDHRNARLGYKACIIAFGYKISCFKERLKLQMIYIVLVYLYLYYTCILNRQGCVPRILEHILNLFFTSHVDEYAKITKICKLIMDSTGSPDGMFPFFNS